MCCYFYFFTIELNICILQYVHCLFILRCPLHIKYMSILRHMCHSLFLKQYISRPFRSLTSSCAGQAGFMLLDFEDIAFFFQAEGLWKPCIKQVYWRHFSNRRWLAFFSSKVYTLCFLIQCYCTLNRLQDSVNITSICTGKPKNSWDSVL